MDLKVNELRITNVSYRELKYIARSLVLTFEIDGFRYNLHAKENEDGMVHPIKINHLDKASRCKHCEDGLTGCYQLMKYQKELFHRLIEFPSIRLEWVYIDHV